MLESVRVRGPTAGLLFGVHGLRISLKPKPEALNPTHRLGFQVWEFERSGFRACGEMSEIWLRSFGVTAEHGRMVTFFSGLRV